MSCNLKQHACTGIPHVVAGVTNFSPSIPKFYWDVDSQEQSIKNLCKTICALIEYCNSIADSLNQDVYDAIEKLQEDFKAFVEHGFDDYYREQIEQWFKDNALSIYKLIAKNVFFGLTDDGYFCAYVPDGWQDIQFDTGAVYGVPTYGHLILRYDADGSGIINNSTVPEKDYNDLYINLHKCMKTLYTPTDTKEWDGNNGS